MYARPPASSGISRTRFQAAKAKIKKLYAHTGKSFIIGITGAPGAGKSTLTDALITELRKQHKTVGVLAVDPTSPFTGGAILGDRIRMQRHAEDSGVFIRSLATRGALGGLSGAAGMPFMSWKLWVKILLLWKP